MCAWKCVENVGCISLGDEYTQKRLTLNSKAAIPIPEAAPVPARPMKWPDPILLANNDAPTGIQCILLEAIKYPATESLLLFHDDWNDTNFHDSQNRILIEKFDTLETYVETHSKHENEISCNHNVIGYFNSLKSRLHIFRCRILLWFTRLLVGNFGNPQEPCKLIFGVYLSPMNKR